MRFQCNGTRAEVNLIVNDFYPIQEYEVADMFLHNVNRTAIQDLINAGIGANNGEVSFKMISYACTSLQLMLDHHLIRPIIQVLLKSDIINSYIMDE
ncbi:TIGR04279 domain-containing protein [Methanococcoides sp. SA1]|nr:TIGR04279 domain-containing protein [Methanococcoides sp. SA1]